MIVFSEIEERKAARGEVTELSTVLHDYCLVSFNLV